MMYDRPFTDDYSQKYCAFLNKNSAFLNFFKFFLIFLDVVRGRILVQQILNLFFIFIKPQTPVMCQDFSNTSFLIATVVIHSKMKKTTTSEWAGNHWSAVLQESEGTSKRLGPNANGLN